MLWGKRLRRRWFNPVAGFLLAIIFLEASHDLLPNLIPSLVSPVQAATATIDPDGDGTVAGTRTTCGTAADYDCVNDAVRDPTAPSTAGDYVQFSRNQVDNYTMGTITNVNTVSSITVHIYHVEGTTNFQFQVGLFDAAETTQYGTTQNVTIRTTAQWDTVTISGLSMTQAQLDAMRLRTTCTRPGTGSSYCRDFETYAEVTYTENINITVGTSGNQANLDAGTTNQHIGGAFNIEGTNGSRSVTSIKINENGTVDGQNNLDNIKLYYDLDTSSPYNCASESFNIGTDSQYGSTDTDGFSAANGNSTFTGSVTISPTQTMCVYVILDVLSSAASAETIEVEISNPTTDVAGSGSPVISPGTAIAIANTTTIQKTVLTQVNYHWRNDDGNESGATSATAGSENTSYNTFPKGIVKRLRLAISNAGNKTSSATQYRLEFATKVTTCAAATGWTDVGGAGGAFDMSDTGNLTDGNDTTNISVGSGGVSNPNTTFLTPNAAVKDTSSQTGNITLTSTQYAELEYAIVASSTVTDGTAYCFKATSSGTDLQAYTRYAEITVASDILVTASSTVSTPIAVPQTDQYAGGKFVIKSVLGGSYTMSSLKIKAAGTVDAQNKLTNIKLRYDLDTSAPYDCASESHSGAESQYGSTGSFNSSKESTFTGSVTVNSTQSICVYVVYTASSTISNAQTLTLSIANAYTDVVAGSASIGPNATVAMSGTTIFSAPYVKQSGYHWRNDDGSEAAATSATSNTENTALLKLPKSTTYRLRLGVANTGASAAGSSAYRLEWAQKTSTCAAATGWTRVDTASDAWQVSNSTNIADGGNTTDIAVSTGGVTNAATTFIASNGGLKDTSDQTAALAISADNVLELEYALQATTNAVQGASYCFRVTAAGTTLAEYTNYAEATIKLDTDFKIQRGFSTMTGTTLTITAGTDYVAPASTSSAFIRITNTQLTGAGPNTGAGSSNANDVTAYISNPENITTSITFQRGASTDNTRISWEIVEYKGVAGGENEIKVRKHEILTYASGNTTVNSATINGIVDDNDVVVFITSQYNPDAGRNAYNLGLSTSAWSASNNQAALTRSSSGNAAITSYAAVEFTGSNWKIQRSEHTYTAVGTTETNSITAVNSLSRTFLHVQKRTAQTNHADFGHEVWLSGIGQVSFALDGNAGTAANHTSVAWVIENTQTQGLKMDVTRSSSGFGTSGSSPQANNVSIGKTLDDLSIASIFANNRSDGTTRTWPEPIMGARIISTTQYELWRSDIGNNVNYRTEIVEWPTAARKLDQHYYRLYVDNNALKPTDPWPTGATNLGENTEMTATDVPVANGTSVRIRISLGVTAAVMPATLDSFKLQFAKRVSTCSAITTWYSVGGVGSTTAVWRGINNTPTDGTSLSSTDPPVAGDLVLSVGTVAGTYEEENDSSLNPFLAYPGDDVEYDWVVQHNGATDKSSYCFRMVDSDGELLNTYTNYPVIRTVGYEPQITDWRWYEDETNATPSNPRANLNIAPSNVENQNALKLRVVLKESSGANGVDLKFALQYSEYADFSQKVYTLTSTSTCTANSLWCYYNGAGTDNGVINSKVITSADSCSGGVGNGCGTYNENSTLTGATFDQLAYAKTEYEFTLKNAGARVNAVYYFRLYNLTSSEIVYTAPTYSYPSLVTEGAEMTFTISGLNALTSTAGIITDATTTASSTPFGRLPMNSSIEAAQRISINTNATQGYQVLQYGRQQLLNSYSDSIPAISSSNATPAGWATACSGVAIGCFGYHTTDATLTGGSTRFAPTDSYAALSTSPQEVMYSSIPINDTQDLIYKIKVTQNQPSGDYQTNIVYIAVPVH